MVAQTQKNNNMENVIELIDSQIAYYENHKEKIGPNDMMVLSDLGAIKALKELKDYLEYKLESELNSFESTLGQAE